MEFALKIAFGWFVGTLFCISCFTKFVKSIPNIVKSDPWRDYRHTIEGQ